MQAIVEDGYSDEVEGIVRSDWFRRMQIFTAVYGSGPRTSERWIRDGMTSIDDVIKTSMYGGKKTLRLLWVSGRVTSFAFFLITDRKGR